MSSNVEDLAAQINAMTPPNRLRMAAALIERGEYRTAEIIAQAVVRELQALRLLRTAKEGR